MTKEPATPEFRNFLRLKSEIRKCPNSFLETKGKHFIYSDSIRDRLIAGFTSSDLTNSNIAFLLTHADEKILQAVVDHFGAKEIRNRIDTPSSFSMIRSVLRCDPIEKIELLVSIGVNLQNMTTYLAETAFARPTSDLVDFYERHFGHPLLLLDGEPTRTIDSCSEQNRQKLIEAARRNAQENPELRLSFAGDAPLKNLAFLTACGFDLRPTKLNDLTAESDIAVNFLCWLHKAHTTSHGKIELASLEPDPMSILARPANGTFYGWTALELIDAHDEHLEGYKGD